MYITYDLFVKLFLLSEQELNLDGQHVDVLSHLVRQAFHAEKPGVVLLGGDDDFRFWCLSEYLVDALDVLLAECVVVGEGERRDVRGI